jgi:cytochrome c oxidase assembly protein subunit 15
VPPSTRRRVTGPVFRWFALATFLSMIAIILTGEAVRLTGSGLGCPDWPTCFKHQVVASSSIHSKIEFGNRLVTVALVVIVGATFVAALLRERRRRDLELYAGALIVGVIANAVLGAFVVYSKLNPYLVSLHLLLSLLMVVLGATLYHHSKYVYGPGERDDVRDPYFRALARWLWVPFFVLVLTGTATTGSGPHAGSSQGQLVARRLPFALSSAAWVHSLAAVLFIGLVTGMLFAIWRSSVPNALKLGVRRLVYVSLVQAAIGATQYLTHLPGWLVEVHAAGAIALTIGVTQFNLRQHARDRVPGTARATPAVAAVTSTIDAV